MSISKRHFGDSGADLLQSNLSEFSEEQSSSSSGLLRCQLALEYKVLDTCKQLLHFYKESHNWVAVSQVAQSLITNSQRIAQLKEQLYSGNTPFLLNIISESDDSGILEETGEAPGESQRGEEGAQNSAREGEHNSDSESAEVVETADSFVTRETAQESHCLSLQEEEGEEGESLGAEKPYNFTPDKAFEVEEVTETAKTSESLQSTQESCDTTIVEDCSMEHTNATSESDTVKVAINITRIVDEGDSKVNYCVETNGSNGWRNSSTLHRLEEFGELREKLASKGQVPELCASNGGSSELENGDSDESQRLADFLNAVVQDPRLQGEPVLLEFLSASEDVAQPEAEKPVATPVESNTLPASDTQEVTGQTEEKEVNGRGQSDPGSDCEQPGSGAEFSISPEASLHVTSGEYSGQELDNHMEGFAERLTLSECIPEDSGSLSPSDQPESIHLSLMPSNYPLKSASSENITEASGGKAGVKRQRSVPSIAALTSQSAKMLRKFSHRRHTAKLEKNGPDQDLATVKLMQSIPTQDWDPTCLLEELYSDCRQLVPQSNASGETARHYGYMEKLPVNQSKATMMKGWKRRYFRAMEGNVFYYEDRTSEKALGLAHLVNSKITLNKPKLQIQVVEKSGKSLVMKAPDVTQLNDWYRAFQLEAAHPTMATVMSPTLRNKDNSVLIIDIGACSVRAGFANENAYPEVFFPAVCSIDAATQEPIDCGLPALLPYNRYGASLVYPRKPSVRMDRVGKSKYNLQALYTIIYRVIDSLTVTPLDCHLLLTLPPTTPENDQNELAELLLESFRFSGIYFQEQAILALYSYNTTSGIVVDIGDHIDIVPVIDGFKIESGVTRLLFGGNAITESFSKLITSNGIRYFSETETFINRFIKESLCFVSQEFVTDSTKCEENPAAYTHAIDLDRFQLPDHRKVIALDIPLFKAPEGLFNPGLWGKDVLGLHEIVWKAVQACPIDQRRELSRKIYLSGATSLLPGLANRLQKELCDLAPQGATIEVHASDTRHHAAYIGASVLASLSSFQKMVITQEEWGSLGLEALKKWDS